MARTSKLAFSQNTDELGRKKYFVDSESEMLTSHHPASSPEAGWMHIKTHPNGVKEYKHEEGGKGWEVLAKDGVEATGKFKEARGEK